MGAAREQRSIEADNQFSLKKTSFREREWWAREREANPDIGTWDSLIDLHMWWIGHLTESPFMLACRLADQQQKPPAPVKSKPNHHIAPKAPTLHPTKVRLRTFWREVMAARETNPRSAELEAALMQTARECGLVADVHKLGGHGEEDVRHVIRWGHRGWDPWGKEFPNGV
jgi:hypothetical protein